MPSVILGLDIGGANLKAATSDGRAASVPFALWKQPEKLPVALSELIARFPDADELAVTMTGELCDCFETKREGVRRIVAATELAGVGRRIRYWGTDGGFHLATSAIEKQPLIAAANWHALATFVGRHFAPSGFAILIDVGSTTTDLIPLIDGQPKSIGLTDESRMRTGELVYTGIRRTPATTFLGFDAAAEFFATVHDAHLVVGNVEELESDLDTADGRPATRPYAHGRLSRMLGGDPEQTPVSATEALAELIVGRQRKVLSDKIAAIIARFEPARAIAIVSGSGEFLAFTLASDSRFQDRIQSIVSVMGQIGPECSEAAPAYAVARLAAERLP